MYLDVHTVHEARVGSHANMYILKHMKELTALFLAFYLPLLLCLLIDKTLSVRRVTLLVPTFSLFILRLFYSPLSSFFFLPHQLFSSASPQTVSLKSAVGMGLFAPVRWMRKREWNPAMLLTVSGPSGLLLSPRSVTRAQLYCIVRTKSFLEFANGCSHRCKHTVYLVSKRGRLVLFFFCPPQHFKQPDNRPEKQQ